jgi:DNA-binding LacI/PurR family transcriptional regulator
MFQRGTTFMKGKVSQRDLARMAGVSPMTVSLALRGHPSISAETTQRIVRLAEEQKYRPDPVLSVLNAYRIKQTPSRFQGTIFWLTAFPTRSGWRDMIQTVGYFNGALERARQLGYHLEEFWLAEPGLSERRATQILMTRGVRGIVVAPLPKAHSKLKLDWSQFCAVALGYSLNSPHLHVVMNHQFRNMKQAVQQLDRLGYKRIGLAIPSSHDERVDHNYLGGFLVGLHDTGEQEVHPSPLLARQFDQKAFVSWFQRYNPDAVVVAASTAYKVIGWLKDLGLHIPRDVGLAVASVPFGDKLISGIDEDVPRIGAQTVDAVVGMIHRNEQGIPSHPVSYLIEGVWTNGQTVRPQRTSIRKSAV